MRGADAGLDPEVEAARLAAVRRYAVLDTPPEGAFDRVCAIAVRMFDVPIATVTIVDEDRIWFKAATGLPTGGQIGRDPGLCASAIHTDVPYVVSDAATDPRTLNNPLVRGELGLRFYAAAPLVTADGHKLGTVNIIDTAPRQVTDAELAMLADLADIVLDELELRLAAMAQVSNEREATRRVEAERRHAQSIATTLGRSLMPTRLPEVRGLQAAAFYQPLSEDTVGGDCYDLFPTDAAGRWGVFLGDVCGKGVDAAAMTSLIRYTLRAVSIIEDDPASILTHLHHALLLDPDTVKHDYCTAVYARVEPQLPDWRLTISVGGHPPPIVIDAAGNAATLAARGPAIGLLPDVHFDTVTVDLRPGETIVFYTDGITDLRIDDTTLGSEGLAHRLHGTPTTAADLVARLHSFATALHAPRDDIAVLALSVPVTSS